MDYALINLSGSFSISKRFKRNPEFLIDQKFGITHALSRPLEKTTLSY